MDKRIKKNTIDKKILIITDFYEPNNSIASVRSTKIAKYLNEMGYQVTVLTDDIGDNYNQKDVNVIRLNQLNFLSWLKNKLYSKKYRDINKYNSFKENKIKTVRVSKKRDWIYFINNCIKNINFLIRAIGWIIKQKELNYQIIISTYGQFSPHLIANYMKCINENIWWIADFRDRVFQYAMPVIAKKYCKRYTAKIIKNCDIVTCVSQGVYDSLNVEKRHKIVTNGFDWDDLGLVKLQERQSDKIIITYTGTIYNHKSNLGPFFQALDKLCSEKYISLNNFEFHYAGLMFDEYKKQIDEYLPDAQLINHGYITKDESLTLQYNSDILLLASWNNINDTGIITGKIFEYMMMKKLIVACVSGNVPNSELKKIFEECKLGFCFEEAEENDQQKLYSFLKEAIKGIAKGYQQEQNKEAIEKYNYKKIAYEIVN